MVKTERIFRIIDGEQEDGSFIEIERFKGYIVFDQLWFSYNEGMECPPKMYPTLNRV